ncbi:MAG: response regulator [Chthoniobacteraceae bacterium]|nr:response regulator [Chthoniobacteraceae bacterium]
MKQPPSTGAPLIPIAHDFTALLCIDEPDVLEGVRAPLAELGFAVQPAVTVAEAVFYLHSQPYDVVVVNETFCGADAQTHPILSELAELPLDLRRLLFIAFFGAGRSSNAPEMEAFALSVDLLLGPQDLPNLKGLVGRGLTRHAGFYAAYHAAARRLGNEV